MSEALQISNYSKSFNSELSTRVINDFKKTTNDTVKTKFQYFKKRRTITSESTVLDSDHLFSIPVSHQYVSSFYLEFTSDDSLAWDIGVGGACNLIKQVKIESGSEALQTYTGNDLYKLIHLANKDSDNRDELVRLMKSGDTNADVMLCPLICPGSNGIIGLDSFDARSPAWPIGAMNNPLTIRITLQTGAYVSKTNAFVLASMKLRFFSYAVANDNLANIRPSNSGGIFYTWNYIKTLSNEYSRTLTNNSEDEFTIDNVITQGLLNGVVVDVLDKTTQVVDKEYFNTEGIDTLKLVVRGNEELYIHESQEEGSYLCLNEWKVKNKYSTSATGLGYLYPMSVTSHPWMFTNIGGKGLNLNLNKPTIKLTVKSLSNSGTSHFVRVMAIYKCLYNIYNSKDVKDVIYIQ
jgi:hypothetical protein